MKYRDYKINAKKHLDACISILNTYSDNVVPESVLRELHYLSGYIRDCRLILSVVDA